MDESNFNTTQGDEIDKLIKQYEDSGTIDLSINQNEYQNYQQSPIVIFDQNKSEQEGAAKASTNLKNNLDEEIEEALTELVQQEPEGFTFRSNIKRKMKQATPEPSIHSAYLGIEQRITRANLRIEKGSLMTSKETEQGNLIHGKPEQPLMLYSKLSKKELKNQRKREEKFQVPIPSRDDSQSHDRTTPQLVRRDDVALWPESLRYSPKEKSKLKKKKAAKRKPHSKIRNNSIESTQRVIEVSQEREKVKIKKKNARSKTEHLRKMSVKKEENRDQVATLIINQDLQQIEMANTKAPPQIRISTADLDHQRSSSNHIRTQEALHLNSARTSVRAPPQVTINPNSEESDEQKESSSSNSSNSCSSQNSNPENDDTEVPDKSTESLVHLPITENDSPPQNHQSLSLMYTQSQDNTERRLSKQMTYRAARFVESLDKRRHQSQVHNHRQSKLRNTPLDNNVNKIEITMNDQYENSHSSDSDESPQGSILSENEDDFVEVRCSEKKKPAFQKFTTSKIYRDFTQISKYERQESMREVIEKLEKENKEQFFGKRMRFECNANYFQCISNPMLQNTFILAYSVKKSSQIEQSHGNTTETEEMLESQESERSDQKRKGVEQIDENLDTEEHLQMDTYIDDNQLFNVSKDLLIPYGYSVPLSKPQITDQNDDIAYISFLSQNDSGQYDCFQLNEEVNLIKRPINFEKNLAQALFIGQEKQVFYFSKVSNDEDSALKFNIIDMVANIKGAEQTPHNNSVRTKTSKKKGASKKSITVSDVRRYYIKQGSLLQEQIRYQFLEHKESQLVNFCMPEPNLIKLDNQEYLVMTVFDEYLLPSICFFQLKDEVFQLQNFSNYTSDADVQLQKQVSGDPTFQIIGGEIFLRVSQNSDIFFFTNERSIGDVSVQFQSKCGSDYSRLVSPSQIKKLTLKQLKQLQLLDQEAKQSSEQFKVRNQLLDNLPSWSLQASSKSMNFFRCQSNDYPYVQAVSDPKNHGCLLLRFFGNEKLNSAAIAFNLQESKGARKAQNQPNQVAKMKGYFQNEDNEQVQATFQIKSTDASNNEISHESFGTEQNGQKFLIHEHTLREDWVQEKWFTSSISKERHPFQIESLEFDPSTGKIVTGTARIEGFPLTFNLIKEKSEEKEYSDNFRGETYFNLQFQNPLTKNIEATIQGFCKNEPFNTQLIGKFQFTQSEDTEDEQLSTKFAIHKRISSTITLELDPQEREFDVQIACGQVIHQQNLVYFTSEKVENFLFQNVQEVVADETGTFIFHGSLQKLQKKKKWPTKTLNLNRWDLEDCILKMTQVFTVVKNGQMQIQGRDSSILSEQSLHKIIKTDSFTSEDGLIQALSISQTLEVTFSVIKSELSGQNSVNFLQIKGKGDEQKEKVNGLIPQQWIVDYPLLAYNSYLPNNSEIVITNFANRQKCSQILNLGSWKFICFVKTVHLCKLLHMNPMNCQIMFLTLHRKMQKLRLAVIDQDPWTSQKTLKIFGVATSEIKLPPLPVEQIKEANLLWKNLPGEHPEMNLLLQYDDEMWSVALTQHDKVFQVFDPTQKKVYHRKAIRRINDTSHVYCIVHTQTKEQIVRVGFSEENKKDTLERQVETFEIYESLSARIIAIETDPNNSENIFVIDDEQRIMIIIDKGEGKAIIKETIDMSIHSFEDELILLDHRPFKTISLCSRVLTYQNYYFSLKTKIFWKTEIPPQAEALIDERNLFGTLFCLQLWRMKDGSFRFFCNPLAGSNYTDLLGQSRTTDKTMMYLASEDKVFVNVEENKMLVFDLEGYIIHEDIPCFKTPQTIMYESIQSHKYGRFFLMKNIRDEYTLLQSDSKGLQELQSNFTFQNIAKRLNNLPQTQLLEYLNTKSLPKLDLCKKIQKDFRDTLRFYEDLCLLSKKGDLIILASAVVGNVDTNLTFYNDQNNENNSQDEPTAQKRFDDHSGYSQTQKLIGIYQYKHIKVILFLCQSSEFQEVLMNSTNNKYNRKVMNTSLKLSQAKKSTLIFSSQRSIKRNSSGITNNMTFSIVDNKLIWLNFQKKQISHIDLDAFENTAQRQEGKVGWALTNIKGFIVKDVLERFTLEDYRLQGIFIDEISEESAIRTKKVEENHDGDLCLMQLTVENNAIVYNLQPDNRYEVEYLRDINSFQNPVLFSNTGFTLFTFNKTFETNLEHTIGLERPCPKENSKGLYRPFSEMDLKQIMIIQKIIEKSLENSRFDVGQIETQTLFSTFGKETFFSLFAEQSYVYNMIKEQLQAMVRAYKQTPSEQERADLLLLLRRLYYVLNRPTPVRVKENKHLTDMSIMKQCLSFKSIQCSLNMYKVAVILNCNLIDYISCINDLQMLVTRLPSHQFSKILNSLRQNAYTRRITEAVMQKRGINSQLATFQQNSAVITENTPQLGLKRQQDEEEVKRSVIINVLPLQWIQADEGSQEDLFQFFRAHLDQLMGSLLLDAMFSDFWSEQQKLILQYVFFPYLLYFLVAMFYYYECLLIGLQSNLGVILKFVCWMSGNDDCDFADYIEPYFRVIFLLLMLQPILVEILQFRIAKGDDFTSKKSGLRSYFSQSSRQMGFLSIFLNLTPLLMRTFGADLHKIRIVASMGIVSLWVQLFFWFRLFDSLAQYVDLILQTMYDIKYFMYVMWQLMFMFGSGLYMLQMNRISPPLFDTEPVYQYSNDGSLFGDAMRNQYFLILGDFENMTFRRDTENLDDPWFWLENFLVMIYFIGSTFFTQIVILNMLIAIMSSTFDRHNEDLQENAKRQKLVLQAEYIKLVNFYQQFLCCYCSKYQKTKAKRKTEQTTGYLFVIRQTQASEEESIEDAIMDQSTQIITKVVQDKFHELEGFLNKKILQGMQDIAQDTRQRLESIEKSSQIQNADIKKDLMQRFVKLKEDTREQIEKAEKEMKTEINRSHKIELEALHKISVGKIVK